MRKRAQFSVEQRQRLLEAYQQSGLSVSEFARRNGLRRSLLSVWLMRYVRQSLAIGLPSQAPTQVPLREVSLGQLLGQPPWAAELILPAGITVRLDARGQAQLLQHLLKGSRLC